MIDQWKFMSSPRFVARVDLIEMVSGLLLVLFMFGHTLMLSTIHFGPEAFNSLAKVLEKPPLYMAQVGGVGVAVLVLIHLVTAGRKLPSRVREQTMIWRLAKQLRHTDTWLWLVQAVTGMILLLFAAIHLWVVLTTFPIDAMKSAMLVAQSYGYLYILMIPIVYLHVGVGLYRAVTKWTSFNHRVGSAIMWGLTGVLLLLGYSTLVTFWSHGIGVSPRF